MASMVGPRKGRGALSNRDGRYEALRHECLDDPWDAEDEPLPPLATTLAVDHARSVITYNRSPDIPFDRSINPYRGCEHGCIYCYARPTHAYLGLSPGLDFETRLFYKPDAPALLARELGRRGYTCAPVALGANTDAYQPAERRLRITRGILEVLAEHRHPVVIVTKSALVERDLDLLAPMAEARLAHVVVSLTGLDPGLKRIMEPRAASPGRRLTTIARLGAAGVPVSTLYAPVIPALNDHAIEATLAAARDAGAIEAGYVLLRLPLELEELFQDWLRDHLPLKAAHVMSLLREARGGRANDPRFGSRMRGQGQYAQMIAQRFRLACRRLGLNERRVELDRSGFAPPPRAGRQMSLL